MKNLVKIKETLYCSVRHYGKALLLLVALTALNGSAWAEKYANYTKIGIYNTGYNIEGMDGISKVDWGTKTSVKFTKLYVNITRSGKHDDCGKEECEVNSITFYWYFLKDGSDTHLSSGNYNLGFRSENMGDCNDHHQYWDYMNDGGVEMINNLSAGNYTFHGYFKASTGIGDRYASNGGGDYLASVTVPGFKSLTPSSLSDFGNIVVGRESSGQTVTCTFYGSNNGLKSGKSSNTDFTVSTSGNVATIKFTPKSTGNKTATITLTDNYGKTATISVSGTGLEQKTPTVYIGAKEVVDNTDVTLNGYVKFTGCYPITEYGFLVGTDEMAVKAGTGTKHQGTTTGTIAAGSDFTLTQQFADNLYYYRAWIKANGTDYYSSETRSFQIIGGCPYPTPKPTLTMDGNVNNLVCLNETSTAECRSAIGYTYYLYKGDAPAVDEHGTPFAERPGTGATFKWTGNFGAGTFTVRTKPVGQECLAVIATATQEVNNPTLTITASKDEATAFEPVTISMDDGQTGLTKPIWTTTGGYLLDSGTGLIYSGKDISEVTLKAGVDAETAITVTATSYKAMEYEGVTKTCPATATEEITVSPATEDCP